MLIILVAEKFVRAMMSRRNAVPIVQSERGWQAADLASRPTNDWSKLLLSEKQARLTVKLSATVRPVDAAAHVGCGEVSEAVV